MTRALVLFESMFGNTQQIAEAVREGLHFRADRHPRSRNRTRSHPGRRRPDHRGRPHTRVRHEPAQDPRGRDPPSRRICRVRRERLREWITGLERAHGRNLAAAAFDTRIAGLACLVRPLAAPRSVSGSSVSRSPLRRRASTTGTAGPLVDGETDRARRWGEELGKGFMGDPTRLGPRRSSESLASGGDSSAIDVLPTSRGEETA